MLLLAVSSLYSAELSAPERTELLNKLQAIHTKNPTFQADFKEEKITRLLKNPLVSEGTISFESPNKFRREIKGKNPSLTVTNGKKLWIYYPNFKELELYTLGQRSFFDESLSALTAGLNFQQIDQFYNVKAFRDGDELRLRLAPKRSNLKRLVQQLTITMDAKLTVQKTEIIFAKGDRLTSSYKNQQRPSIPDSTFEFAPPEGVHVTQPMGE